MHSQQNKNFNRYLDVVGRDADGILPVVSVRLLRWMRNCLREEKCYYWLALNFYPHKRKPSLLKCL